jgi:integrase
LEAVDRDVLDRIVSGRLAGGASPATCNRTLAVVRSILRMAWREWGWIDSVPPFRTLKEPKRRIRWLSHDQAARLLRELPPHLAEMARFALATGLREANVVGLSWASVDLDRGVAWVNADEAKSGRTLGVPLNDDALAVLRRQRGRHPSRVFTFDRGGVPVPVVRCQGLAWRKALDRAAIAPLYRGPLCFPSFCGAEYAYPDFRWHDLRHTWATWHVQSGTPLGVLQELGGWSDIRMVQRYAHFAPGHLAGYANAISVPGARGPAALPCLDKSG